MKSFSESLEEDRTFEIGGEIFTYRLYHWTETLDMLEDKVDEGLLVNEDGSYNFRVDTEWCLKKIPDFLEPGDRARFKALMGRKTNPVPRVQIASLYVWLRQKVQALPTTPPSPEQSVNGGGNTEAESSAGSPSTAVTPTA